MSKRRELIAPGNPSAFATDVATNVLKNIQYVTDASGKRTAVIIPLEEYENLLEDIHVTAAAYESRNEPCIPLSKVIEELRAEGKMD